MTEQVNTPHSSSQQTHNSMLTKLLYDEHTCVDCELSGVGLLAGLLPSRNKIVKKRSSVGW